MYINHSTPISGTIQSVNGAAKKAADQGLQVDKNYANVDKMDFSRQYEESKKQIDAGMKKNLAAEAIAQQTPADKLQTLKDQIEQGKYTIDAMSIARNMIWGN